MATNRTVSQKAARRKMSMLELLFFCIIITEYKYIMDNIQSY